MTIKTPLHAVIAASLISAAMALPALAEDCGLHHSTGVSQLMTDDGESLGSLQLGETPAGYVLWGKVDGSDVNYRMKSCDGGRVAMFRLDDGMDGPSQITLEAVDGGAVLGYKDPDDGSDGELFLMKNE